MTLVARLPGSMPCELVRLVRHEAESQSTDRFMECRCGNEGIDDPSSLRYVRCEHDK